MANPTWEGAGTPMTEQRADTPEVAELRLWTARHLPGRRRRSGAPRARFLRAFLAHALTPQRHADEGKKRPLHPRQANASALRPTVDPGLRREDGDVGASWTARYPPAASRSASSTSSGVLALKNGSTGSAGHSTVTTL
jgi:hypothetical protein